MDIDNVNFNDNLSQILSHIRKARFVAFDLELSGIPARKFNIGYPSLTDRYVENKGAAEKFHILQIGLTCVEEDAATGTYLLRPYNFNLSPLIADDFGIDRSFTYSASAVNFLLNNNYDMASPFTKGIPYLTRAETERAKLNLMKRYDKESIPDVYIRPDDQETPAFMSRVKHEISEWQRHRPKKSKSLEVRTPNPQHPAYPHPLDRLQRRIVHQIVRSDFPLLTTVTRRDGVDVQLKDSKEEAEMKSNMTKRIANNLRQQIGFRWIAEALAGKYESATHDFEKVPGLDTTAASQDMSPKVLLGHNCFMDLVFLFHLFYGSLPDTLEEFREQLHQTFPLILDSKFLATSGDGRSGNRRFSLGELENLLAVEDEQPSMQIPFEHATRLRLDDDKYHEAGFDSFVTAKIFIRMAAKAGTAVKGASKESVSLENATETTFTEVKSKSKRKPRNNQAAAKSEALQAPFSHSNPFESLTDADMQDAAETAESPTHRLSKPRSTTDPQNPSSEEQNLAELTNKFGRLQLSGSSKLMPPWGDEYWQQYRNKLRVYGTSEEECDLSVSDTMDATSSAAEPTRQSSETQSPSEQIAARRGSILGLLKKAINPFE